MYASCSNNLYNYICILGLDRLGDGSLAQARRVRQTTARSGPAREPTDATHLDTGVRAAATPTDPAVYSSLLESVRAADEYDIVHVTDMMMGISRLTKNTRNARRTFFKGVRCADFDIYLYVYNQGGPYPSTAYVWRLPTERDEGKQAAAVAKVISAAPAHAGRSVMRDYFNQFNSFSTGKAALRGIFRFLSPTELGSHSAEQRQVDDRCARYLMRSDDDPLSYFDNRALNGPD